jgi:ABC-type transport system involved in multi-copper enzyme maturation permease subunit
VLVLRGLAALLPALVVVAAAWACWFMPKVWPEFSPTQVLLPALVMLEGMLLSVSLVLTPAMLAGSLAGDQFRATLNLLLICQVSPREVVVARLAGRLCVVGAFLLAGTPSVVLIAALCRPPATTLALLTVLPVAVSFGAGGLAVATSAMSRRGRDAVLVVYLLVLVFMLLPMAGGALPAAQVWLNAGNPYLAVSPLVYSEDPLPAVRTISLWMGLGAGGVALAAWRLRPAQGAEIRRRRRLWRGRVPPVSERPVLWKELYVEQARGFNRLVRWLGVLVAAGFLGVCGFLAGAAAWDWWTKTPGSSWALAPLGALVGSSWGLAWLIQWAMGMRAAVAVASERERNTWEALMMSPLEGREIVWAKLAGSLYSLRWFVTAVILGWSLALASGAMGAGDYAKLVGDTLVVSTFMVAVGVWHSLTARTATRAMTWTVASWLGAAFAASALAALLVLLTGLALMMMWLFWESWRGPIAGLPGSGPPGAMVLTTWFGPAHAVTRLALYALAALVIALYCRSRFDRLSGRSFAWHWKGPPRRRRRIKQAARWSS